MKKFNKILAVVLCVIMVMALLAGCGPKLPNNDTSNNDTSNSDTGKDTTNNDTGKDTTEDTSAPPAETVYDKYTKGNVTLRMAFGYNSTDAAISFNSNIIETYGTNGVLTLADGKEYRQGELKPTWQEMQNRLGITFVDVYQGNNSSKEWAYWENQLDQLEVIYGGLATLNNAGLAGSLVNIADYLDMMPNFKAYLDANPIVYLSITADPDTGAIYFSPYFDGANDIERMPLMRTDWVVKLLDGEGAFAADKSGTTAAPVYQPYITESYEIDVVKADGSGVETIKNDMEAAGGNIVAQMNAKGAMSGVDAVNMLRDYIDKAYNGYYGTTRSNLFVGQNAAWDADELVALLRCVVANAQTLNGTDKVFGIFSREDNNMQRKVDMYRLAAVLFGVRGLESRSDFLYADKDGKLHDARQEPATYEAMDRMHAMAVEGLISESFLKNEAEKTQTMLENDLGFMHYDYNQTQTIYNEQENDNGPIMGEGEKYMAVMIPVAKWDDGDPSTPDYFRFTESWRSVKDSGIAITKAGVADNEEELYAALAMIDYAFSKEGQILQSYGPAAFIKTNADGSYVTFNFNGEQWPEIADATREELWSKGKGNYTNYARYFLGSTITFLKSQSFEYQCTTAVGREGAGYLSTAIGLGTIKHPELEITDNKWYTSIPSALPIDETQSTIINGYTDLTGNSGKFGTSKDSVNEFVDIIINGYAGDVITGVNSGADVAAKVASKEFGGSGYLDIVQEAWDRAISSYNG